jgi:uncharacterized protein (TIGR02145 family)
MRKRLLRIIFIVKYSFVIILIILNFNAFTQIATNINLKQKQDSLIIYFDLLKDVKNLEILISETGEEFKSLVAVDKGKLLRAGKSKSIIIRPGILYCSSCIIRIKTYENKFFDDRDQKVYNTVTIDKKIWMSENLRYSPPHGSYFCSGNQEIGCTTYGYLYDWETAKKVCPSGWHLPSEEEWKELVRFCGGSDEALLKLKSPPPKWSGSEEKEIGFKALPSGFIFKSNSNSATEPSKISIREFGQKGYWWSSSDGIYFYIHQNLIGTMVISTDMYFAVRCIKN